MLTELDVHGVVLGHSERRQYNGETDKALSAKVPAALAAGLVPILCVGETEAEREAGDTERKLRHQVQEGLEDVETRADRRRRPRLRADLGDRNRQGRRRPIRRRRRSASSARWSPGSTRSRPTRTRVLYGGSVNPDNAAALLALPDVDGALVGGASLEPASFAAIVDARRVGAVAGPYPSVCLVVLDGWGLAPPGPGNAVELADTPVFDGLWSSFSAHAARGVRAAVGLPDGQMGNSEVGHLNLGAGAVLKQDLTRIDEAVDDGSLAENAVLKAGDDRLRARPPDRARQPRRRPLVRASPARAGADGRRAARPRPGRARVHRRPRHVAERRRGYVAEVEAWGGARIGSVDRALLRDGPRPALGAHPARARPAARQPGRVHAATPARRRCCDAYERDETDEFIAPTKVGPEARIRTGDSVIAFNFRPDRMRQLTEKLAPLAGRYTTLTEYEEGWTWPVAFPPARPAITLPHVIERTGGRQLHVAETEKYPHVTYFFGGGEETPCTGERRELVPSPRDVATYDLEPRDERPRGGRRRSSARGAQDAPAFGIINFANPDMVGHTGVIPAAVDGVETVDACLATVVDCVLESGGALVVTADHGNADEMLEADGSPDTAHSLNPVPLVVVTPDEQRRLRCATAACWPTWRRRCWSCWAIEQPGEMTGRVAAGGLKPHHRGVRARAVAHGRKGGGSLEARMRASTGPPCQRARLTLPHDAVRCPSALISPAGSRSASAPPPAPPAAPRTAAAA